MSNIETTYIDKLISGKHAVTVFLVCGVKLQGILTHADETTVLLRRDAHCQLIYKHAISTIMPVEPILPD